MQHQVYHAAAHSNTYRGIKDFTKDGVPLVQAVEPFPDLETRAEWATHVTVTDNLGATATSVLHHLTLRITSRTGSNMNLYEIAAGAGAKERATRDALATLISMGHILTRRQQNKPTIHFLPVDNILNTSSWYPRADIGFTRDNLKRRQPQHAQPQMTDSAPLQHREHPKLDDTAPLNYTENNELAEYALPYRPDYSQLAESAPPDQVGIPQFAKSAHPKEEIRRDINISRSPTKRRKKNQQPLHLLNPSSNPSHTTLQSVGSVPDQMDRGGAESAPQQRQPRGAESARRTNTSGSPPAEGVESAPPDHFDENYVRQTLRLYRELNIQRWTDDEAAVARYKRDYPKFLDDLRGWRKRQQTPSSHTAPQPAHSRDKYLKDYLQAQRRLTPDTDT